MSTPHEVKSGEWLQKIAEDHGFSSWRDLYNHEDNAAFRAKRPDPNKIYPGDVIMIPDQVPSGDDKPDKPKPKPKPKGEDELVTAEAFDTLCSIAVEHGFADCLKLRAHPDNKELLDRPLVAGDQVTVPAKTEETVSGVTEKDHKFKRRGKPLVSIRFVHGASDDNDCAGHSEEMKLSVSNYQTDKAGKDRTKPFVTETTTEFEQHAHDDEDTFKVEVHEPRTNNNKLKVNIEALRPQYDPAKDPTETGEPKKWVEYGATEKTNGRELLGLDIERMPKGANKASKKTRFRSGYLRLVVDEADWTARKKQTLRIEPMADTDEKLEVLDHKIRATLEIDTCPGTPKCRVVREVKVGKRQKRLKLVTHILRKSRAGAGVLTIDQTRKFLLQHMRQFYAQADLSIKFVGDKLRLVPPPANLIAISNRDGKTAVGKKTIKIRVTIDGTVKPVEIETREGGVKPIKTAQDLAAKINVTFGKPVAKATENPPLKGSAAHGSADVLVGDPMTQVVSLNVLTSADANHHVKIGRIDPTVEIPDYKSDESRVGTPEERVLVKNYDSGNTKQLDLFIVNGLKGAHGEAFSPRLGPQPYLINTVIVGQHVFTSRIRTVPHEIGHVLMAAVHARGEVSELMTKGGAAGAKVNQELEATKRLADPKDPANHVNYDLGVKGSSTNMVRTKNSALLTGW